MLHFLFIVCNGLIDSTNSNIYCYIQLKLVLVQAQNVSVIYRLTKTQFFLITVHNVITLVIDNVRTSRFFPEFSFYFAYW